MSLGWRSGHDPVSRVLVEREQATPGDAWDVPRWRRLTVLGVDNAYTGDGCRVVVELTSPGT